MAEVDIEEKFDCEECLRKGLDKPRNCNGDQENPKRIPILHEIPWMYLRECPVKLITEEVKTLWREFCDFSLTGHLPYSGGYKEQPNILIEVFGFCEGLLAKIKNDPNYTEFLHKKLKTKKEKSQEGKTLGEASERVRKRFGTRGK